MARPVAERVYRWAKEQDELSPAAIVDFGIDSPVHAAALIAAVENGASAEDLDKALGNGKKLTRLVKKFVPNMLVGFQTSWDMM